MRDQIFARFVKNKKRVAILRGGPSSEHATSLKSGANIIENLDKDKYIPVDIYIDKKGSFYLDGVVTTPYAALQFIDVAFSTIHGEFGEDGKIQAILEEVGVLYVGTDSFISSLAIDKHISKLLLTQAGVKVARHKLILPHTENL
jgi:D-alanine-D-alanine ligase